MAELQNNDKKSNEKNNNLSTNKVKEEIKKILIKAGMKIAIIILPLAFLILFLIGALGWLVHREEGTWKDDEKGRPSTYTKTAQVSGNEGINVNKEDLINQALKDMKYTEEEIANLTEQEIIEIFDVQNKLGKTITSIDQLTHAEILWCTNEIYSKYLENPEDLQKLLDAELITQYPKIDGLAEEKLNGIVEFVRYSTDPNTGEEIVRNLKWISNEEFTAKMNLYQETGNDDILNYFTLDESGNVKIATWSREEGSFYSNDTTSQTNRKKIKGGITADNVTSDYDSRYTITKNDSTSIEATYITYTITEQPINYKIMIQKYTLPFEYLWALLVTTKSDDFVLNLADLAYNSEIKIGIYDNINKIVNTHIEKYREEFREKYEEYEDGSLVDKRPSDKEWDTEEYDYEIRNVVTTYNENIQYELLYANTWIVEVSTQYENTVEAQQVSSDTNADLDEEWSDDISPNPYVKTWTRTETHTDPIDGSTYTDTINCKSNLYKYKRTINHEYISENAPTISQYQKLPAQEPIAKIDTDENTDNNFIKIALNDNNAYNQLSNVGSVNILINILEGNADTVSMVDLTKQLIYALTENDSYNMNFDFDYFASSSYSEFSSSSSLIVKTDVSGAAPTVGKSELENGIRNWVSGRQQTNALRVLDKVMEIEQNYKINAVFIYALLQQESSIGTANSTWVAENNWTSLTSLGHIYYESPQANLDKFVTSTICGSYYFKVGRYSVHQIGELYCADPPPPTWANGVVEKMLALYNSCGVEVQLGSGNSEVIDIALSKLGSPYVWGAKGPNSFDCSGFVNWCFKQIGITVPGSTSAYSSYKGTANEISLSEIQPGDVLHRFSGELGKSTGHVAIYLGNGEYVHAAGAKWGVIKGSNISSSFVRAFRFTE